MKKLFIISNESISNYNDNFFCDNIDIKSTPESLSKIFEVNLIARKSKKIRSHKINLTNVKIYSNIFCFLFGVFLSLGNKNAKYLIISISPFTFAATILLKIFKKKPYTYLRSDGYEEYKAILGFVGPIIYHFMYVITSRISFLISCRNHILKGKKGYLVKPSQLNNNWFFEIKESEINKPIKLLYIGRISIEKGIFSLLSLLKENQNNFILSIVGAKKNTANAIFQNNVYIYEIENNEKNLIRLYDDHDIFVLPSFTEGYPMVLLESLARLKPVIIFKEIEYIIGDKKGIFIADRNFKSFYEKVMFIKENYKSIQNNIKKNLLPTHDQFILQLKKIINTD